MTDGAHRRRIIAAAIELTARSGWATVTMAVLAESVGVSRQTVYNEIGSKQALAEAMVHDELGRFLAVVEQAFDREPADLAAAVRGAVRAVLDLARDNALLRAIVSATHDADTDLLPLLTTHAGSLLTTAKTVLTHRLAPFDLPLDDHQLAVTVDVVVRAVLSHVMQPSDTPERTAADIAWLVDALVTRPGAVAGSALGAAGGSR
ncbi:MAG TPA: TetR family transcriptional regulator [Umezawaea sp.]|nr:TetR family transcriptional regulator [Umezawaea sp.]